MKYEQKNQVIELRRQGMSLRDIAKVVRVSRSSISKWTRDIELTPEQVEYLNSRNAANGYQTLGGQRMKEKHLNLRLKWREEGKKLVPPITSDHLFIIGCMLFWAEGSKERTSLRFCNSDVGMMQLWMRFLRECFNLTNEEISVTIHCHTIASEEIRGIENYWLEKLSLPIDSLRKTYSVVNHPRSKEYRKNKHPFGVCRISVHKTEITQKIFGAITEIGQLHNDICLN